MSDLDRRITITDEMVEVAAKTRWDYDRAESGDATEWDMRYPSFREFDTDAMRAALEAAAPLIAAQALRDAVDELRRLDDGRTGGYYEAGRHIIRRLDARADQIEAG